MKKKDIKAASKEELQGKLGELRKELMKQNAQIRIGTAPANPGKVKQMKKMIVKIITQLNNTNNNQNKKTEAPKASSNKQEV